MQSFNDRWLTADLPFDFTAESSAVEDLRQGFILRPKDRFKGYLLPLGGNHGLELSDAEMQVFKNHLQASGFAREGSALE